MVTPDLDLRTAPDEGIVRTIVLRALDGVPVRVFLFGSRARGDARRGADFDIALLGEGPLPAQLLAQIRDELEESVVTVPVDLVDLGEAPASLREAVLREGREWTASPRG